MKVEELSSAEWARVLVDFPEHGFFCRPEWYAAFEAQHPGRYRKHFLRLSAGRDDIFVSCMVERGKYGLQTVSSSPMSGATGIFSRDPGAATKIGEVLRAVQRKLWAMNVSLTLSPYTAAQPSTRPGSDEHNTHLLALEGDYEAIHRAFQHKVRKNIAMAERSGLVASLGEKADLRIFHELMTKLYAERFQRSAGDVLPLAMYQRIFEIEGADLILVRKQDTGQVVCATVALATAHEYFQWHSAMNYEFAGLRPNDLWESFVIRRGVEKKIRYLNFGASPTEGVEKFKESFGAKKSAYHRYAFSPRWVGWLQRLRAATARA